MAVQATTGLTANMHVYYVKKLLKTLQPRLVIEQLAKKTSVPRNTGKQVKWLTYTRISGSTSALTEGTNPSEGSLSTANVDATVAQYGQFVKISDLLSYTSIDPIIENVTELMARAAAETIEMLHVAALDAALTVQYVNDAADADALTEADVVSIREFLRARINLAKNFVGQHEAGHYAAVLHPNSEYDLLTEENLGAYLDRQSYQTADKADIMQGQIGKMYNIRFLVSDKMTAADNATPLSVKNNYLIGEECFGAVSLEGKAWEILAKNPSSQDTSNPLNMFSTVGYKLKGYVSKNFAAGRGRLIKGTSTIA